MHGTYQHLLHLGQFDVLLVATFSLHACRDTTDDDDGVGHAHLLGQVGEVSQSAFADITTQHGEVACAATIFYHDVISLALLYIERLILGTTATSEASEATTATAFVLLNYLTVYLQHIAIIGRERIFHLASEGSLVGTADAYGQVVVGDALGKAPGTKGREVQFLIVTRLDGVLEVGVSVVPELYLHTLAIVEFLQMVHGGIFIIQFTSLVVDNFCVGQGVPDAFEQRVLMLLGRRAAIVTVQQFHIIGIRTEYGQRLDALGKGQYAAVVQQHH